MGNKGIRLIINELMQDGSKQIGSVQAFLEYMHDAKSLLFSLKFRFAKKIGKEEFLQIENFLEKMENLVESFKCKKIDEKLLCLLEIKEWFIGMVEGMQSLSQADLKNYNLKLTHLLTVMNSISYEDNVVFKIIQEKTSRGLVKRSFEDEVRSLKSLLPQGGSHSKKAA